MKKTEKKLALIKSTVTNLDQIKGGTQWPYGSVPPRTYYRDTLYLDDLEPAAER